MIRTRYWLSGLLFFLVASSALLAQSSTTPSQYATQIIQHVTKADIEAVTGVALKDPIFTDVDFKRSSIASYRAVKPRPYDAEVCIITLGLLDKIMYEQQVKVDKGMGYKGALTGFGDSAYWCDLGQGIGAYTKIGVRKGEKYLSVTLTDSKQGLVRPEAVKQLVYKLLSAL
jgi:hypothetical protein